MASDKLPTFTFADFLLKVAPNEWVRINDLWRLAEGARSLAFPTKLALDCPTCKGERLFQPNGDGHLYAGHTSWQDYMHYVCRNCGTAKKTYALHLIPESAPAGRAVKYGESPAFGPTVSPSVIALLADDTDLFRKGLVAEGHGLGIGAYGYYRRVVENQRLKIFDKIIQVAEKLDAGSDVVARLTEAKDERQFTRSIGAIKPGPLKAIYIDGHNPLTLLHDAISDGLHGRSDAENLAAAQTVRVLLTDLARRVDEALADHDEVKSAVASLLAAKNAKQKGKKGAAEEAAEAGGAPAAESGSAPAAS